MLNLAKPIPTPIRLALLASMSFFFTCASGNPPSDPRAPVALSTNPAAACKASPWKADTTYATGDTVLHVGKMYRCVQGHTSLNVWPPDAVPALWSETAVCTSSPSPSTTASSSSSGSSTTATIAPFVPTSPPSKGTEYAPYFYAWGWGNASYAFTSLVELQKKTGLNGITLAFVLGVDTPGKGCTTSRDIHDHLEDVNAFRKAGGRVKASFGGADGRYLEAACGDAPALAKAIRTFVDETGITDLDFDVEQHGVMNPEMNKKRAAAFALVQNTNRDIRISLTLAAMPHDSKPGAAGDGGSGTGGMSPAAFDVFKATALANVKIHRVNLMTMDYGAHYSTGHTMGELAESALVDANAQIRSVLTNLSEAQAFAMLGATAMIGNNDVAGEVFTLADARRLANYAREKKLGLVSFWAINRDQSCKTGLAMCSMVNTGAFDFHKVLSTAAAP